MARDLWRDVLESASAGATDRSVVERTIVVLGGGHDAARHFRDILRSQAIAGRQAESTRPQSATHPPRAAVDGLARQALVFDAIDITDRDEELVAHLSFYYAPREVPDAARFVDEMLSDCHAVVFLLDWNAPLAWMQSLQFWRSHLGKAFTSTPLLLVCMHAEQMRRLEKEHGLGDADFDYVQQTLRSVCLHYGAALAYHTLAHDEADRQLYEALLHLFPPITEALALRARDAEIVEREQVYVPISWDTPGKIRTLNDEYDVDAATEAWLSGNVSGWEVALETTRLPDLPQQAQELPVELQPYKSFVRRLYEQHGSEDIDDTIANNTSGAVLGPIDTSLDHQTEAIAEQLSALRSSEASAASTGSRDEVVSQFFKNLLTRGQQ